MIEETIAKLVGVLRFDVDTSGFRRFEGAMRQAQRQMTELSRQAAQLQKQLHLKMGLTPANDRAKIDRQLRTSLDRELRAETLVQKARRATFQAELAGQKLQFANQRESMSLATASVREQQASAVLQAKLQRVEQSRLKAQGQAIKNEDAIAQAKARQARSEAILATQQQKTLNLEAQRQRTLTGTQRLAEAMENARAVARRAEVSHRARLSAQAARESRQSEAAEQRSLRFQGWQARQAVWAARQTAPEASTGGMGLAGMAVAGGGVVAGLAAVVAAVNALGERLDRRQARASEAQTYGNIFQQIGGKNPANATRAEQAFAQMTERYGMANNVESASDFRTFMLSQQARGIAMQTSLNTYATQLAAFRAAGMGKTEQQRAVIQLQQVRSIGKADTEDVKTFAEAAPLIKQAIVQAWGQRTGYKGDNLDGAFMKSIPDGKVLAKDFEAGFALFVSQQQDTLARQMQSIDAQQQRSENARYLQSQSLNSSPELVKAIGDRITAETELTQALAPLREAAVQLDTAFLKLTTRFVRWALGEGEDNTTKAAKADLFSPDKPALDPLALTGADVSNLRASADDPIDRLWRTFLGKSEPVEGPFKPTMPAPTFQGIPTFPALKLRLPEINGDWFPIDRFPTVEASAIQARNDEKLRRTQEAPKGGETQAPVVNNDNSHHVNVAPASVVINVTPPAGADPVEVGRMVRAEIREELEKTWQGVQIKEVK